MRDWEPIRLSNVSLDEDWEPIPLSSVSLDEDWDKWEG